MCTHVLLARRIPWAYTARLVNETDETNDQTNKIHVERAADTNTKKFQAFTRGSRHHLTDDGLS